MLEHIHDFRIMLMLLGALRSHGLFLLRESTPAWKYRYYLLGARYTPIYSTKAWVPNGSFQSSIDIVIFLVLRQELSNDGTEAVNDVLIA